MTGAALGPRLDRDGVTFRLWAPAAERVSLVTDDTRPMPREGDRFELFLPGARAGTRYRFRIDDAVEIPDPASHFQPEDVAGPSEVIDHRYRWRWPAWRGLPWERTVISEVHVGTFTPDGTFRAMIERLDYLADTGFTALELMPMADFPGRWNWGYDGVLPFAPDSRYGRPEELKALIDAAHGHGLMVFLDVVYNHVGPQGCPLERIAPAFFSDAQTPWGRAIDYRVPEVRRFAIENALHWLVHYRFDGLRLDAVHAIETPGEPELLTDLSLAVGTLVAETGRHIHLVLENGDNRASLLAPAEDPPEGHFRAQWNDDYHHAWHVLLTGESAGLYGDYQDARRHIVRTLAEGFSYQGEPSVCRGGKPRGEPSTHLPPAAFVNFIQNHDQIGNRARGERLTALADPAAYEAATAVLLLQPSPPLMFMGEEWDAREPFPFFCDFTGELADAVRAGRRREYAAAYAGHGDDVPDPMAPQTRAAAVLDWEALRQPARVVSLARTRSLIAARRRHVVPLIPAIVGAPQVTLDGDILAARWSAGEKTLLLLANLSGAAKPRIGSAWGEPVWGGEPPRDLPPWSVFAAIGTAN